MFRGEFVTPANHSLDFPNAELKQIFPLEQDQIDAMIMFENFDFFLERKRYDASWYDQLAGATESSKKDEIVLKLRKIRSWLSKDSLEKIMEKAMHQNDRNAMLDYADCMYLGLKGHKKIEFESVQTYGIAGAELRNPEASTAYAYIGELRRPSLLSLCAKRGVSVIQEDESLNNQIWEFLNKAVELGWKSPFALRKVCQEKETSCVPPRLIAMLHDHEKEVTRATKCQNCSKDLTNLKATFMCRLCKLTEYCSSNCQEADLTKHLNTCIATIKSRDEERIRRLLIPSWNGNLTASGSRYSESELVAKVDDMIAREAYVDALRTVKVAIEKYCANKSVIGHSYKLKDQVDLAKLVGKRAICYLKLAERNSSVRDAALAEQDCNFVLPPCSIFSKYLVDKNKQVYESLIETRNKSTKLKDRYVRYSKISGIDK